MPVHRPRTRLVNFRVNEEEYAVLLAACSQNGARSVSDFARLAVMRQAGADDRQATSMQWRLSALGHKMSELECRVLQLLRLLETADSETGGWASRRGGMDE
ncbi:MAG TPA: hypothetical protein VLH09_15050 [Bryobacteraceae bacterium]|nr:hypothetical protein [Bryobacteraceae bacterium]